MAKEGSSNRVRKWVMTMQGKYEKHVIEEFVHDHEQEISYIKIAHEISDGGKDHLQGYFELSNKVSLKGVVKLWQKPGFVPSHFEIAWKPNEAREYIGNLEFVHKDGLEKKGQVVWVFEYGTFTPDSGEARRQGAAWNESLLEIKKMVDEGKTLYSIYQSYFIQMVYCGKAIAAYKDLIDTRRKFPELDGEQGAEEEAAIIKKAVAEDRETKYDITPGYANYL